MRTGLLPSWSFQWGRIPEEGLLVDLWWEEAGLRAGELLGTGCTI